MSRSLKAKMMLIVIICVTLLIGISSWLTYNQIQKVLHNSILDASKKSAEYNARIISEKFQGIISLVEILAGTDAVRSMFWDIQEIELSRALNKEKSIETLFVADKNGVFNMTSGATGNIADRDYFKKVMQTGDTVISDPIINRGTGERVIVIATPIKVDEDTIVGLLGATIELHFLQELVKGMKINGFGYGWIIDSELRTIAHPEEKYLGNTDIFAGNEQLKTIARRIVDGGKGTAFYGFNGINKELAYAPIELMGWSIAMIADTSDIFSSLNAVRNTSLIIGLVAIFVGLIVAYFIAGYFASPILDLNAVVQKVAEGDLTQSIRVKSKDEIGRLADSFNQMVNNLQEMIERILQSSAETSSTSQELAASSEEASASIEEVSNSIQQLSITTEELSKNSQIMAAAASEVNDLTDKGLNYMISTQQGLEEVMETSNESRETIISLNKANEEIKGIVDVISKIADQTSLLALNAAIEAARAGEQGKGFAVVADEVRELAEETQKSAGNIHDLIERLVTRTGQAVNIITENNSRIAERVNDANKTRDVFENIAEKINSLVSQIEEVAAAAQQFSGNIEQISAATEEQSASMQQISSSAQQLASIAQELNHLVNRFKVKKDESGQD